jgi:tRNA (cytidine/uridine-2'-O-)-methyltransferase
VVIPIRPSLRSLNVAMSAAMALGEALRQTGHPMAAETGSREKV